MSEKRSLESNPFLAGDDDLDEQPVDDREGNTIPFFTTLEDPSGKMKHREMIHTLLL